MTHTVGIRSAICITCKQQRDCATVMYDSKILICLACWNNKTQEEKDNLCNEVYKNRAEKGLVNFDENNNVISYINDIGHEVKLHTPVKIK